LAKRIPGITKTLTGQQASGLERSDIKISFVFIFILLSLPCLSDNVRKNIPLLQEEYLTIRIDKNLTAHVTARFIFAETMNYESDLAFPGTEWFDIENFTAIWDNKNLHVEHIKAADNFFFKFGTEKYKSLYKFRIPVTDKNTAEHIITYKYKLPFINFKKDYESKGYYIEYILKTGSSWSGRTSRLSVKIIFENSGLCSRIMHLNDSYVGKCEKDGLWIFEEEDIKLSRNIRLLIKSDKQFN
jgi:hypothetical protein